MMCINVDLIVINFKIHVSDSHSGRKCIGVFNAFSKSPNVWEFLIHIHLTVILFAKYLYLNLSV